MWPLTETCSMIGREWGLGKVPKPGSAIGGSPGTPTPPPIPQSSALVVAEAPVTLALSPTELGATGNAVEPGPEG